MFNVNSIFADFITFQLAGFLAAVMFFIMVGLREIKGQDYSGFIYLALALFFLAVHGLLLWNQPTGQPGLESVDFWQWTIKFLAPATIALYIILGMVGFFIAPYGTALLKISFGCALFILTSLLGGAWPIVARGVTVLIGSAVWLKMELDTSGP